MNASNVSQVDEAGSNVFNHTAQQSRSQNISDITVLKERSLNVSNFDVLNEPSFHISNISVLEGTGFNTSDTSNLTEASFNVSGLTHPVNTSSNISEAIFHPEDIWAEALLVWLGVDGFLSLCMIVTKSILIISEVWSGFPYLHKLGWGICHVYGIVYGFIRIACGMVIFYTSDDNQYVPLSNCAIIVGLELPIFLAYVVSALALFILIGIQLSKPMYKTHRHIWWVFGLIGAVSLGFCCPSLPGLAERSVEVVKWYNCTWNIYPLWNKRLVVYGIVTPVTGFGMLIAIMNMRTGDKQSSRIANQKRLQTKPGDTQSPQESTTKPKRRAPRLCAMRVYIVLWMLSPAMLYLDHYLAGRFTYVSVALFTTMVLTTQLSDCLAFFNRESLAGLNNFWRKLRRRFF